MQMRISIRMMQSGPEMLIRTVSAPGPLEQIQRLWAVDNKFDEATAENTVCTATYYFNIMRRRWHGFVRLDHPVFVKALNMHLEFFFVIHKFK